MIVQNGNGLSSGEDDYILIILLNALLKTTTFCPMTVATEETPKVHHSHCK